MLFTDAADPDTRMNMPGEIIRWGFPFTGGRIINICYVMHKGKSAHLQTTVVEDDAGGLVPIIVQNIMITFDKTYGKMRKILSPSLKERQFLILSAVKEISHHQ